MTNTTLCYIEKDGAYLMLHRTKKENDYNRDKWIGIGGKCEDGESPEDCIRREAREETGLELKNLSYRGIVTFVSEDDDGLYTEFMHLFHAEPAGRAMPGTCDEGDLEWVAKDKMNSLPHWKGDEIFLRLLDEDVPFFSLKLEYKNGKLLNAVLNEQKLSVL